jgi:hypothetical protein
MPYEENIEPTEATPESGLPPPSNETPPVDLSAELSKVYDDIQSREARQEITDPEMPSRDGERLEDTFERSLEWQGLPSADKAIEANAAASLEARRRKAKELGVSLAELESIRQNELLEEKAKATGIPDGLAPAFEGIKQDFPDSEPAEVMKRYAEIGHAFKENPVETALWAIEQQTGMPALETARLIARQYSEPQVQQFFQQRDAMIAAEAAIESFYQLNPDARKFEDQMLELAARPDFQRSGNVTADLQKIYRQVSGKKGKGGRARNLESDMREAYERMQK